MFHFFFLSFLFAARLCTKLFSFKRCRHARSYNFFSIGTLGASQCNLVGECDPKHFSFFLKESVGFSKLKEFVYIEEKVASDTRQSRFATLTCEIFFWNLASFTLGHDFDECVCREGKMRILIIYHWLTFLVQTHSLIEQSIVNNSLMVYNSCHLHCKFCRKLKLKSGILEVYVNYITVVKMIAFSRFRIIHTMRQMWWKINSIWKQFEMSMYEIIIVLLYIITSY